MPPAIAALPPLSNPLSFWIHAAFTPVPGAGEQDRPAQAIAI